MCGDTTTIKRGIMLGKGNRPIDMQTSWHDWEVYGDKSTWQKSLYRQVNMIE